MSAERDGLTDTTGSETQTGRALFVRGVVSAILVAVTIVLFDIAAGQGASGIGVGTLPVAAAFAIAPCYVVLVA